VLGLVCSLAVISYISTQLSKKLSEGIEKATLGDRIVIFCSYPTVLFLTLYFCYNLVDFLVEKKSTFEVVGRERRE
jgi:hypothetical protein